MFLPRPAPRHRKPRHHPRLLTPSHSRWMLAFTALVIFGWTGWDAVLDGYAGLPVNTIGQIFGDVLLALLTAPFIPRRRDGYHPLLRREQTAAANQPEEVKNLLTESEPQGELATSAETESAFSTTAQFGDQPSLDKQREYGQPIE